ncbi:MAG: glycosyltransferase [Oscillospiraceae bacterium]|nr:glycosyltransferase [Oscillospiraceae bacterium]
MTMTNKEKNFISAVVYLHNDGARAVEFFRSLAEVLDAAFEQYELVAVDDACTDDTIPALRAWAAGLEKPLTVLHMSLHQGLELAMNAGLDAAIGDYVYEFDSCEMPYSMDLVVKAYRTALSGSDIVSVCPNKTAGSSRMFYRIFNANSNSAYRLRTDAFRLVSRRAINRVHASSENLPYRKAAYAASGLKMTDLEFDGRLTDHGEHRFNLAMDSLALYTDAGFRLSAGIAIFMMVLALAELAYTLIIFCTGHPIEGWTTTMFVLTLGFAGLFAVLTIVIKYLSLLVDLTFKKQRYLIESIEKIQK